MDLFGFEYTIGIVETTTKVINSLDGIDTKIANIKNPI
jgi:hypothetical protein